MKKLLKNSLPISDKRLENLPGMGLEVNLLLYSKLFDSVPMNVIANSMSTNYNKTNHQRTLNFHSASSNEKKIPKQIAFQNIEIDRSVLVDNVKNLVKKINNLNLTKSETEAEPLDAWQF